MKKMSYQEKVRQSTQESFGASKFAIKKALALLLVVVAIGIITALVPKIKASLMRTAQAKVTETVDSTRRQMSPLEAMIENVLNSIGF